MLGAAGVLDGILLICLLLSLVQKYPLILNQVPRGLSNAQDRLSDLRKQLKRSRCPQALVEELDAALHLIQTRIVKLEGS